MSEWKKTAKSEGSGNALKKWTLLIVLSLVGVLLIERMLMKTYPRSPKLESMHSQSWEDVLETRQQLQRLEAQLKDLKRERAILQEQVKRRATNQKSAS